MASGWTRNENDTPLRSPARQIRASVVGRRGVTRRPDPMKFIGPRPTRRLALALYSGETGVAELYVTLGKQVDREPGVHPSPPCAVASP